MSVTRMAVGSNVRAYILFNIPSGSVISWYMAYVIILLMLEMISLAAHSVEYDRSDGVHYFLGDRVCITSHDRFGHGGIFIGKGNI